MVHINVLIVFSMLLKSVNTLEHFICVHFMLLM